jgi:hypothetical protein
MSEAEKALVNFQNSSDRFENYQLNILYWVLILNVVKQRSALVLRALLNSTVTGLINNQLNILYCVL